MATELVVILLGKSSTLINHLKKKEEENTVSDTIISLSQKFEGKKSVLLVLLLLFELFQNISKIVGNSMRKLQSCVQ